MSFEAEVAAASLPGSRVRTDTDRLLTEMDLTDPAAHLGQGPSAVFERLRSEGGLVWHEPRSAGNGFWVAARRSDAVRICRDPRFTSVRGNVLSTLLQGGDPAGGQMLAVSDGVGHRELRQGLWTSFTPEALAVVGRSIRTATRALVSEAVARGECDFATEIAARIPIMAISRLMGIPAEDHEYLLARTSESLGSDTVDQSTTAARLAKAELLLYFKRLLKADRSDLDDLMSVLSRAAVGGRPLTEQEVVLNCYSLLLGADETTRLSMIGAVAALAAHPDEWRRLKEGQVDVQTSVEEVLRWTTPAIHLGRTATETVELGGRTIAPGEVVTAWISSANRDPDEFEHPDRLDLSRTPNRHLSFAYGVHFCLGAHLARIEIAALLEELANQVEHISVVGEPESIYSNFLHGFSHLQVKLTPAPLMEDDR